MAPTYLFAGDSITGWSDLSRWLKYSHFVELMIEGRCGPNRVRVLNRGIGGNTTGQLLERLKTDVLHDMPDVTVLLIGGNDAMTAVPREETARNLDQILIRIKGCCSRILLLQYHLLPYPGKEDEAWLPLKSNNDLIADAAKHHGCALLDMNAAMWASLDRDEHIPSEDYRDFPGWRGETKYFIADLVGTDGVHMTPGGELVYARSIFEKLRQLDWLPPEFSIGFPSDRLDN